jgi:hypothetical protein
MIYAKTRDLNLIQRNESRIKGTRRDRENIVKKPEARTCRSCRIVTCIGNDRDGRMGVMVGGGKERRVYRLRPHQLAFFFLGAGLYSFCISRRRISNALPKEGISHKRCSRHGRRGLTDVLVVSSARLDESHAELLGERLALGQRHTPSNAMSFRQAVSADELTVHQSGRISVQRSHKAPSRARRNRESSYGPS